MQKFYILLVLWENTQKILITVVVTVINKIYNNYFWLSKAIDLHYYLLNTVLKDENLRAFNNLDLSDLLKNFGSTNIVFFKYKFRLLNTTECGKVLWNNI